jgi:hypothetical protein
MWCHSLAWTFFILGAIGNSWWHNLFLSNLWRFEKPFYYWHPRSIKFKIFPMMMPSLSFKMVYFIVFAFYMFLMAMCISYIWIFFLVCWFKNKWAIEGSQGRGWMGQGWERIHMQGGCMWCVLDSKMVALEAFRWNLSSCHGTR